MEPCRPGGYRPSSRTEERWNRRLEQLKEHVRSYGRNPGMGRSGSPEEQALGKWLSVPRHLLKKGALYPERAAQLDTTLTGWRRPPVK
ncbi:helicase associated domain-containing protein [Arthrobacter sp. ZGTC412]|uniref:helicase associated domain-containing protein n=1 Tax=Arthrobacter sp. ZGTC412 TaxID=2058900 RepID=UPI0015E441E5